MSVQTTYGDTPVIGFNGMLAQEFSLRQVDSGLAESAIVIGAAVKAGTSDGQYVPAAATDTVLGIAIYNTAKERPESAASKVLQWDADFVTSNSITLEIDGAAIAGSPVVFSGDQATTLALVLAAINAEAAYSAVAQGLNGVLVTSITTTAFSLSSTVTLGASQAVASEIEVSSLIYFAKDSFPVLAKGRYYAVANAAIAINAAVGYDPVLQRVGAAGGLTTAAFGKAITSAAAAGDLLVIEVTF